MKYNSWILVISTIAFPLSVQAEEVKSSSIASSAEVLSADPTHGQPFDQTLTVQAGAFHPHSITFTNWNNNTFKYDTDQLNSFSAEMSWGIRLFQTARTSFHLSEGVAYSSLSLQVPKSMVGSTGNQSVTMSLFGLDSRIVQTWDTLLGATFVPFWEGGYQYTFYNQSSNSELLAGEGSAGNVVAALGFRYWLNRAGSVNSEFPGRYSSLPLFLTAKLNHVFSNNSGVDMASTSFLAGVSVGL